MATFRHRVAGVYPGGEQWTLGLHTIGSLTVDAAHAAWDAAVTALWEGVAPPADGINQLVSSVVSATSRSTAQLNESTGKQLTRRETVTTDAGTGGAVPLPAQLTLAVSLRTELATRAGRGRFYLPPFAPATVATGGLVSTATQTIIAESVEAMLNSLQSAALTPIVLHEYTPPGPLTSEPITGADVGNVFDTQRRRRNKLQEVRVSITV